MSRIFSRECFSSKNWQVRRVWTRGAHKKGHSRSQDVHGDEVEGFVNPGKKLKIGSVYVDIFRIELLYGDLDYQLVHVNSVGTDVPICFC